MHTLNGDDLKEEQQLGLLIDGQWHNQWYDTQATEGRFVRDKATFRHWVTPDGSPGPTGDGDFPAEAGRYHLFISPACPWCHRTMLLHHLKGLADVVGLTSVDPKMLENGWEFSDVSFNNPVSDLKYLHQLYTRVDPKFTGRVTVPVLWDKARETIVNNESADIVRMFNSAFVAFTADKPNYYPEQLRPEIDEVNAMVYEKVNNGVYRAGFATTQAAYEEAVDDLFSALDALEERLSRQRYLAGEQITEADWRLFPTLARFEAVYYSHFKCNIRPLADYHNLINYFRDLYQQPGVAATCNFSQIKTHYYYSQTTINPSQIVPKGPELDYNQPHDRDTFAQ